MATQLEFIKSASGEGVNNLSVTDCFSDKYETYFMDVTKLYTAGGNAICNIRYIDSAGLVISDSEYSYATYLMQTWAPFLEYKSNSTTGMIFAFAGGQYRYSLAGYQAYIFNPNDPNSYTFSLGQTITDYDYAGSGRRPGPTKHIGVHKVTEQITGINLYFNINTFDMTINIYGVK